MEQTKVSFTMGQKIAASVAAGVLMLMVGMLFDARGQISQLRGDNEILRTEIRHLRELIEGNMDDRYRGADAARDLAIRDTRIDSASKTVDQLASEMRIHSALPYHAGTDARLKAVEDRLKAIEHKIETLTR